MPYQSFEDLEVWKRSCQLAVLASRGEPYMSPMTGKAAQRLGYVSTHRMGEGLHVAMAWYTRSLS